MRGPSDAGRALVVMAKVPRAGQVKTRLARLLSPEQAAELYSAFLDDVLALVDRALALGPRRFERFLAVALADDETEADASRLLAPGWRLLLQRGEGLGARMLAAGADTGAEEVVILGSDSPTLPAPVIQEAFAAIGARDLAVRAALGPTADGGYYAIAYRGDASALFDGIPWSTSRVLEVTTQRARDAGIGLVELTPHYDLDEPEDLARALRELGGNSSAAERTRARLSAIAHLLPGG